MHRWRNLIYMAAALCAVALVIGGVAAIPALAQTVRAALVRDVDNPALQPERIAIFHSLAANEGYKSQDAYVVPAGKRLVVQNVSIWCLTNQNDKVTGVWLNVKGQSHFLLLDPATTESKQISGGATTITAYNRTVTAYFNAGETVQSQVYTEGASGQKLVNMYVQGYLVTL